MKALGDYCGGVPPLSIPNREVKTASADGTAHCCGRVGRRHSFQTFDSLLSRRFFFCLYPDKLPGAYFTPRQPSPLSLHIDPTPTRK